ncbi:hypothetical protein FOA52_006059 [Chlamydomonas sp. UWO 241]|nr:hypothetical protein FOA52_006059 [Chlamydomonas sp. UWO 241]
MMRDAVDAQAGCVEGQHESPVLSLSACARLHSVHKLTLRSIASLRGMLVATGVSFPRLQSLHLLLQGCSAIEDPADYQAIASTACVLTELSKRLPASATAVPQQMAALLSECSKLRGLAILGGSRLVDVGALSAGTQLQRLTIVRCSALSDMAPLGTMVNLQSLSMWACSAVPDLSPLAALVKLQSLIT